MREDFFGRLHRLVSSGMSWSEIAEELERETGESYNPEVLKKIYEYLKDKHSREHGGDRVRWTGSDFSRVSDRIDVEAEVARLYNWAKQRLQELERVEREIGAPLPDTKEAAKLMINALKLYVEVAGKGGSKEYMDIIKEIFGGEVEEVRGEA